VFRPRLNQPCPARHMPRSQPLRLEHLEDRLAPATLNLTGTVLTFTLDNNANAALSGSGNNVTFDSGPGHTITLTGAAAGNGFTGGLQTSTGSITTAVHLTQINIAGAAGTETFTISPLGNPLPGLSIADTVEATIVNTGSVATT